MSEYLRQRGAMGAIRPLVAIVLALLIGFSGALPTVQATAAASVSQMSGVDCPMHRDKSDSVRLGCICVLCALPGLGAGPGAESFIIPRRLSLRVVLHFATGVSATHGPELTANLATGPPSA